MVKIEKYKFRAWSKSTKRYFYGLEKSKLYKFEHNLDFLIEQFTNRYDRNQQEIYEGDIICIANVPGAVRVVGFQKGSFYLVNSKTYEDYCEGNYYDLLLLSSVSDNEMAVIGHIHEEAANSKGTR